MKFSSLALSASIAVCALHLSCGGDGSEYAQAVPGGRPGEFRMTRSAEPIADSGPAGDNGTSSGQPPTADGSPAPRRVAATRPVRRATTQFVPIEGNWGGGGSQHEWVGKDK